MEIKTYTTCRLVKSADLNHHGTLFAGRGAEWFVESGLIAASSVLSPESMVCLKIHGMVFTRPINKGSIIRCESKVVLAGRSSIITYVKILLHPSDKFVVDGFLTFIHVNSEGTAISHGLVIEATTAEDLELQAKAKTL